MQPGSVHGFSRAVFKDAVSNSNTTAWHVLMYVLVEKKCLIRSSEDPAAHT